MQHDYTLWTVKILKKFEDIEGTIRSLQVHWVERYGRRSGMRAKFAPAYVAGKHKLDKVP